MNGNTANDIETVGDAKGFVLEVDGSDLNALEALAGEATPPVVIAYHGSDDNLLEVLDSAILDTP